jgi:CubicO group peptidase (beta-lactamase class C family)
LSDIKYPHDWEDLIALEPAKQLVAQGSLSEAEAILRQHGATLEEPVCHPYSELLETIRRIRFDFPLDVAAMVSRLKVSIPDVTEADVERWRAAGELQARTLDGQVRFFRREPSNFLRFSAEAKKRRISEPAPAGAGFDLPEHLARVIAEADKSGKPLSHPVRHRVDYKLTVKKGHPRIKAGAVVRCWLPFPQEYRQQAEVVLEAAAGGDAAPVIAPNGSAHRTLYLEKTITDPAAPVEFSARYTFVTSAYAPQLDAAKVQPYDKAGAIYGEFTAERPPHIVFTFDVRAIVKEACGNETNPLERARRIFRWVSRNVPWCAEMEYGIIPNLSAKGLGARRGDCGVQGMTFITLCRAAGIPARWQSGWQTQPSDWNMHDWSEIYVEPWGWLPADASYGVQPGNDARIRDYFCGSMDSYRMIVNLDYGRDLVPPKTSLRSEPADFQRGEVEIDGFNLYFDEWDYEFHVETLPLTRDIAGLGEALQAVVPDLLRANNIPGAVVAIGRKSGDRFDTWQRAYGYIQREPKLATMPSDAIFDMASLTKPLATGTCLTLAIEESKVGLDDPVAKYLPEFREGNKVGVTVRHLMTHSSGMPPYLDGAQQKALREKFGFPCPAETRAAIRATPLKQPPGQKVTYSCLNAILCAEIIEQVYGKPLNVVAAERVFGPLGMHDSQFLPPATLDERIVPTTRTDYGRGEGGFLRGQVHDPLAALQGGLSGNAGLFSTAPDLARFAQMLLSGGELDGKRFFKADTIMLLSTTQNCEVPAAEGSKPDRRGLLWDLYPADTPGSVAYGHTGYTGTAMRLFPNLGAYAIVLTNRVHPDDSAKVESLRQAVWRLMDEALAPRAFEKVETNE